MYYSKAKIITNTNTHSGRFVKIVALVDTVINTLTSDVITGTTTSITLKHNVSLEVDCTAIKLDSGAVIAYTI
jgi:hypothetical protein|tara:strand:+ start:1031 stop:1249 length:219 start_codon:yes stop_codon:yes gene_type:complete